MKRRLLSFCACAMLVFAGQAAPAAQTPFADDVTTYAGTGKLGMADGAVSDASFVLPAGLAVARDGTIFVSDEDGERIRAISGKNVTTSAGSGNFGSLGMTVPGGYRDGPALSAQFNHPLGLAEGEDGALYIADSANAAIRKLQDGVVSTVAGAPHSTSAVDGDVSTARFLRPRSLAFDGKGRLWIADFGAGLRCLDHGKVTTIALAPPSKDVLSVAVQPDDGTVLVVTATSLVQYLPQSGKSVSEATGAAPVEGETPYGTPSSIVGLGRGQAVFSDLVASNIRYVRFETPPFVTATYTRAIAGADGVRSFDNAGFADGGGPEARFATPRGLALVGNLLLVADAGNRRIRSFILPDFRLSETGKNSQYSYDDKHYEVALVGPSWVFFDSHDGDSMCAAIEKRLDASGKIDKPARCHTVRIDAALIPPTEDYISANLAFRRVDAIVMSIVPGRVYELSPSSEAASLALFRTSLGDLLRAIGPSKAHLAIFWQYYDREVSDREELRDAELRPDRVSDVSPDDYFDRERASELAVFASLKGVAVTQCDSFDESVAYAKGEGPPLFLSDNAHYSDRGNIFFGTVLGDCLARHLSPAK